MKFFETSKQYSLKKSTYINLRWIGIIGQLISIYLVYFYFNFNFDFISSNLIIFIGIISNLYLIFVYKKTQLSDRSAFIYLIIDILQLSGLIFLTGGIVNPFIIFIIIPSVFASSNLGFRTSSLLVLITTISINKYIKADLSVNCVFLYMNTKYRLLNIPIKIIILDEIKSKLKLK